MSNYMSPPVTSQTTTLYDTLPPKASPLSMLTKQNTSKPLPPLPGVVRNSPVDLNYAVPSKQCDVVDGASKYRFTDIYARHDDDDEEEECDYEYDYVCLENVRVRIFDS